jgi:cysteine desulfuration protein SufE
MVLRHLLCADPLNCFYVDRSPATARVMTRLSELYEEYDFLDADDRYRLLIDLGKTLPEMPTALKTDATLVRGCSASVWVYPTVKDDGALHFLADSNAAITKGIIALVLMTVQDQPPATILATDIEGALAPFDLKNQLSSNRTQGIPNMIALIRETAGRYG